MRIFLIFYSLLAANLLCAQDKEVRKLEKELGPLNKIEGQPSSSVLNTADIDIIWSRTEDSIIIGHEFNGQYVQLEDSVTSRKSKGGIYLTSEFITKEEYLEFQHWVRDSIAREKLYFGLDMDDDAQRFINYDRRDSGQLSFNHRSRKEQHDKYHFNWKWKLDYEDRYYMPILVDMYLPQPERFRKIRAFDERKFYFHVRKSDWESQVPVLMDSYDWALGDEQNFGLGSAIAYLDNQLYHSISVTNIEPFMAEAYCLWKSSQLTNKLGSTKVKYQCRIPTPSEIKEDVRANSLELTVHGYDPTNNWQISNAEFKAFCQHALDSVKLEFLYSEANFHDAAYALLNSKKFYLNEGMLEFVQTDPSDRVINRELFSLNYNAKIKRVQFFREIIQAYDQMNPDSIPFRYQWIDAMDKSILGKLKVPTTHSTKRQQNHNPLEVYELATDGEPVGEDLTLMGYWNRTWGFGTRDHANLQRFIKNEVTLIPNPSKIPENEQIAEITYKQALAYYNWKFRIDLFDGDETDDWQQFIFPRKEEFERVKKGEQIILPARSIPYNSPVFRMVVEVVPR